MFDEAKHQFKPWEASQIIQAIEYLLRAPRKNGKEDIEKALHKISQLLEYQKQK